MVLKNRDNSYNYQIKPRIKYDRKVYWCNKDDIWINMETPSNNK